MKKINRTALYAAPCSSAYWKDAASECRSIRSLSFAALLCALAIVIEKFNIPITPTIQVSMSFLVISLCSMLTGPVLAIFCGLTVDLVGAINSGYSFFAGYTLTAVLTAVIYALFLYRAQITFARIAVSKLCVNLFVNTLLGSVWRVMLSGGMSYPYYVMLAGIKNLVLFPLEVFLICAFFRALYKPLVQLRILSASAEIKYRRRDMLTLCIGAAVGVVLLVLYVMFYDELKAFLQSSF